ncbi:PilZ domain-containing protein [Candidatus Omnitrophota bacterium]
MKEKRKFSRIKTSSVGVYYRTLNAQIRYRIVEFFGKKISSYTRDIGEKGICIQLGKKLKAGTGIEIAMHFPNDPKPVWCVGKVAWASLNHETKLFDTGIEITHVRETDRRRFNEYTVKKGHAA